MGKGCGKRAYLLLAGRNQHHGRIVAKYGSSNIGIFIFPCDSEAQAIADEIRQIAQLRRDGYELCNITPGGDVGSSGYKATEEARRRRSESMIGHQRNVGQRRSPEVCMAISARLTGVQRPPFSAEWRAKLSQPGGKNPAARPVIDLQAGVFYDTVLEAAEHFGIYPGSLRKMLDGRRKNTTHLSIT